MLFSSNEFILGFLPLAFILFHLARRFSCTAAIGVLAGISLGFYGYGEPIFLALLIASIIFNYLLGCYLIGNKNKLFLFLGIVADLCVIGYFKYTNFIMENIFQLMGSEWSLSEIALPLGISFYTFQKIAFLVDAYKSRITKPTPLEYTLFISFFPQLIAGPIVHLNQVLPQIRSQDVIPARMISSGMFLYCIGLFKKTFVADFFGAWADSGFLHVDILSSWHMLLSVFAYTFQIYFDFSAYSDMAIGLGMMFGILLPINFNSPYKSTSIIEFWKRWHITLSQWLRDYVYIPLGGRGTFEAQRFLNVMITMLVGGLWHGAGWTFVIWGGLHGVAIAMNHIWIKFRPMFLVQGNPAIVRSYKVFSLGLTFCVVSLLWIFFRAESLGQALLVLQKLWSLDGFPVLDVAALKWQSFFLQNQFSFASWMFLNPAWLLVNMGIVFAAFLMVLFLPNAIEMKDRFRAGVWQAIFCAAVISASLLVNTFMVTPNAFIYFRF